MKFAFFQKPFLLGAALLLASSPRVLAAPRLAQADDENVIIDADHPEATLPPPAQSRASQKKATAKTAPAAKPSRDAAPPYRAPEDGDLPSAGALPQNAAPGFSSPTSTPTAAPTKSSSSFGSVGGVALIDGTDADNLAILRDAFAARLDGKIVLWDGRNRWTATRAQLGLSIPYETLMAEASRVKRDVPLRFSLDETKLRATLTRLATKIERGSAIKNVAATEKIQVALPASMMRVERALKSDPPQDYTELVVLRAPLAAPPVAKTQAQKTPSGIAAFPYVLASYSTPYNSAIRGRTNNLRMAAKLVNGTVVKAGETFSTNRAIGPRNAAAGWREAKMFINGQIVDGIGSGICQCSTTIYNAALLANLPILERHPHTFRVTYAPASRDAAIYWGQKDMRFRNDTGGAIYVETKLRDGRFHVRLLGTQPGTANVEVQSRVLARGHGTRSEAYRVVKTSGGEKRVRLSRDFYRPHP